MANKKEEDEQKGPKLGSYHQEKQRIDDFLKSRIREAFYLFEKLNQSEEKDCVKKEEIPYIMRYLGQFPSEVQVAEIILPLIMDNENDLYVTYEKFEPYMLNVLKDNEFEPDDPEILLSAFKKLDPENKGYIEVEMLKACFEKDGIKFNENEMAEFIKFATNNAPINPDKPQVVYYEDYIQRLSYSVDKHIEELYKGLGTTKLKM